MKLGALTDDPAPDRAGRHHRTSPNYAVVMALLAAEPALQFPALDFTATESEANTARSLGNDYLRANDRTDVTLSIGRWSPPPYGPGRSGTWRARFVRTPRKDT